MKAWDSPAPEAAAAATTRLRRATAQDADAVAELVAEHAQYERGACASPRVLAGLLASLLAKPAPELTILLAEREGIAIGYASCSWEMSTWMARRYLHMDCLYVRGEFRSEGIGKQLLAGVREQARAAGASEIQWQTPSWNTRAARFYEREGALAELKLRFRLAIPEDEE